MATLAVLESDLEDLSAFASELDLDYGVYCCQVTDARRVHINPSHAGACRLPFFPPEQLISPIAQFTRRVRRKGGRGENVLE